MKKILSLLLSLILIVSMPPAAIAAGFADVDGDAWYADAVDYVVSNKLMSGYSADKFGPNDTLNRAMVVQILYNKEGQPAPSGKHEFNDVASGDWFNNAVTWGTKRGVMSGYGGGRFAPNDNVTLEQIAVILWNYSGNPSFTATADSVGAHSSWAANGLGWAAENGILVNVPYGAVTEGATRAQTAQMLTNFLSGKGQEDAATSGATGITLDITSHKMGEDWTQYLTATLSPAGAKDTITWSSSNPKVATVNEKGKVSGVAGGETIITAKISNGKTATCKIEVWHSHKLTGSKPATCTSAGSETYTCAGCGHSYNKELPALGHEFKSGGTCARCKQKLPPPQKSSYQTLVHYAQIGVNMVVSNAKNPASITIEKVYAGDYDRRYNEYETLTPGIAVCITFRGMNGFGGYSRDEILLFFDPAEQTVIFDLVERYAYLERASVGTNKLKGIEGQIEGMSVILDAPTLFTSIKLSDLTLP